MKIGYALMLNNESHNFIRQIQLELHQKIGIGLARQTPHITIKSPFDINEIDKYVDYIEYVAESIEPIDIDFEGFGNFGDKVIFLDVKQNQRLLDLHWRILGELAKQFGLTPHAFEGKNIKFHASIAGFNNKDSFQQALNYLSQYQPKFSFKAKELGIFYYLGEGNGWIVNRRINIKKSIKKV